jgi:hypothetical protein
MGDSEVIDQLVKEDLKLGQESEGSRDDPNKMLIVLSKRLQLYNNAASQLTDPNNIIKLSNMKESVFHQMGIWQLKKSTEEQFAQIISRLDKLEKKIDQHHH